MSTTTISLGDAGLEPRGDADRVARQAFTVGAVAAAALVAGYFLRPDVFYRAYLVGWLLWVTVAAGMLGLLMLNHVAGGRWGVVLRRALEAAARTLPLLLLLFLPLGLDLDKVYSWAVPGAADHDPLLAHKQAWLNPERFLLGTVVYFALWSLLAYRLSSLSRRHDETGEPALRASMQKWSAGGLVVFVLSMTLASVDWVMSLDPHWFSSLFGAAAVVGAGLGAFAFSIPTLVFLSRRKPLSAIVDRARIHEYGRFTLAFTMLWGYLTISQYLIIWSGNLPEEIGWFLDRNAHGWKVWSLLVVVGQFFVPFLFLLQRAITRKADRLIKVAVFVLAMRWADLYWQVAPTFSEGFSLTWVDLVAPLAIGGLWVGVLFKQLGRGALVPVREPILQELLGHG